MASELHRVRYQLALYCALFYNSHHVVSIVDPMLVMHGECQVCLILARKDLRPNHSVAGLEADLGLKGTQVPWHALTNTSSISALIIRLLTVHQVQCGARGFL